MKIYKEEDIEVMSFKKFIEENCPGLKEQIMMEEAMASAELANEDNKLI